jgi:hypothetical protein
MLKVEIKKKLFKNYKEKNVLKCQEEIKNMLIKIIMR